MTLSRPNLILFVPLLSLALSACAPKEEEDIGAPQMSMNLPASLTGDAQPTNTASVALRQSSEADDCAFAGASDWMANGYKMTQFLLGLSESQSCFIDFLIHAVGKNKSGLLDKGLVKVGNPDDPDSPKFVQLEKAGDTYQLWLLFDENGDASNEVLYLTWTGSENNATGQMIMKGIGQNTCTAQDCPPDKARLDFVRSEAQDKNEMYFGYPDAAEALAGFRVEVTRTGSGSSKQYEAKGYIKAKSQPMPNLPTTETFNVPSFSVLTISDRDGMGGSIANFQDFALHLAGTGYSYGSYHLTLTDKAYFLADGSEEWKTKGPSSATYVNPNGTNARVGVSAYLSCFEGSPSPCTVGYPSFGLGSGYFSGTCTTTDGANCTTFWQGLYNSGILGDLAPANGTDASQPDTSDFRRAYLDEVTAGTRTYLTSAYPTGYDETTTFVVPSLPVQ